jgi:hypothetical protein
MLYKNAIVKRARVWAVPERRLKMIELHKEGYNNKQISEIMGIKTDIVSTGIYLARRDKLLPPPEKAPPSRSAVHLLKKLGRKYADLGRMLQVFDALTKEEALWLVSTLPQDMQMCHYLASFVSDAYAEEHTET